MGEIENFQGVKQQDLQDNNSPRSSAKVMNEGTKIPLKFIPSCRATRHISLPSRFPF
jgi:hypothetical protein